MIVESEEILLLLPLSSKKQTRNALLHEKNASRQLKDVPNGLS